MKIKAAIYARYSSDKQRETSIDDQIRRCQELAQRHNLDVPHELIFFDEALSGTDKHIHKREGYKALMAAWDAGLFTMLILDEVSRLARDGRELAQLKYRLQTTPVRLITTDGIDTRLPNWELMFGLQSLVSEQTVRDTQHRVVRGMVGQLERGYMVATPPLGYQLDRKLTVDGERVGTHWRIDEQEAAIVREIFALRRQGKSLNAISRVLNERGIPIRRKPTKTAGYWRPGSLANLLKNPIYRGEFVWNDSVNIRSKAKKTGRTLTPRHFPRPHLRIVDDATWFDCNNKTHSRSGYGGGTYGEPSEPKRSQLLRLLPGDLLVFYSGFQGPDIAKGTCFVIGYLWVRRIHQGPFEEPWPPLLLTHLHRNAHFRRKNPEPTLVVVEGEPTRSKLLKVALPLSDGKQNVLPEVEDVIGFGGSVMRAVGRWVPETHQETAHAWLTSHQEIV